MPFFTMRIEDILLVADSYRKARDFGRAYSKYSEVLDSLKESKWQNETSYLYFREYENALFGLSSLLVDEGLIYDAEQLLRKYYIESEKPEALKKLFKIVKDAEANNDPSVELDKLIDKEKKEAHKYGGRTISGFSKKRKEKEADDDLQLELFK